MLYEFNHGDKRPKEIPTTKEFHYRMEFNIKASENIMEKLMKVHEFINDLLVLVGFNCTGSFISKA